MERGYKQHAHELGNELLGETTFRRLLDEGEFEELSRRALRLVNSTNLIFPNETMALKDGLSSEIQIRRFVEGVFELLYGSDKFIDRFDGFKACLVDLGADKWTTATYFPFILRPADFMFVKPTVTQHAAATCGFEINYRPQLNWLTYDSILRFSRYLFDELHQLRPRDLIDVQSLMWCIAPGTYST